MCSVAGLEDDNQAEASLIGAEGDEQTIEPFNMKVSVTVAYGWEPFI